LEDALALFRAGEPLDVVADEYGVPRDQLEDAVRIATRVAA
jgi:chloramphenicol 3-O-phosphotransferase